PAAPSSSASSRTTRAASSRSSPCSKSTRSASWRTSAASSRLSPAADCDNAGSVPRPVVDPNQSFPDLEQEVLKRWRERDIFRESLRRREGAEPWVFYEGPPTANGKPGVHHVLARVFKDIYPRFKTMRGHLVDRKGGWDCHGLPVE